MPLLVVGSVAFDSIVTPTASRERVIGGSAVHFSIAASFFTGVRLVGAVGEDWPAAHTKLLQEKNIDTRGLTVLPGQRTFYWKGKYMPNMNDRETVEVQLNALGEFDPDLPESLRDSQYVFLANGSPSVQSKVLDQIEKPKLVLADTMDLWIKETHEDLLKLIKRIDGLVLNDSEAKLLTNEENLVVAGRKVLEMGPKFVILKKGEHGAMFFGPNETYVLPAYPTSQVIDPTGAGDSFAGGMMGYLAECNETSPGTIKKAMAYGTVTASFNVEDFSLDRMQQISRDDIELRLQQYQQMLSFS
jgi:sugar/nucleoside kinase (ribokinase family)